MKGLRSLALTVIAILSGQVWGSTVVSVQPGMTTVQPGSTFTLSIDVANVTDLGDFQFDLFFNPSVLQASGVSEGSFLGSGGETTLFIPGTIDNLGGVVAATADALIGPGPGPDGSGELAIIQFTALGGGSTAISLGNLILQTSNGDDVPFTISNGRVVVGNGATVPEPASGVLLLAGLAAAFQRRSHRKLQPSPGSSE